MSSLTCLDLFSGIGGFALGFQRAGIETVAFCEQDMKATFVLRKRFPRVSIFPDVRRLTAELYNEWELPEPDIICGGFPCQDISRMGTRLGLAGDRSGLWWQFHRVIEVFSPRWVVIENVSDLRHKGLVEILRSLCEIGYDAEWHCITASSFGFPHRRDRIWIVAYPYGRLEPVVRFNDEAQGLSRAETPLTDGTFPQSLVRGVDDGVSRRLDRRVRLRMLGNSLVPQIAEFIGRSIVEAERRDLAARS